jgi:hypothetical protein
MRELVALSCRDDSTKDLLNRLHPEHHALLFQCTAIPQPDSLTICVA